MKSQEGLRMAVKEYLLKVSKNLRTLDLFAAFQVLQVPTASQTQTLTKIWLTSVDLSLFGRNVGHNLPDLILMFALCVGGAPGIFLISAGPTQATVAAISSFAFGLQISLERVKTIAPSGSPIQHCWNVKRSVTISATWKPFKFTFSSLLRDISTLSASCPVTGRPLSGLNFGKTSPNPRR